MPYIAVIAAMDRNRVIGNANKLPAWNAPGDLKRFRELTEGKVVVMGRKTFESIGKPLPRRLNMVVSSTLQTKQPSVYVARSFEGAIHEAAMLGRQFNFGNEIMVIGGSKIYEQAMAICDKLYLTLVHGEHEGDAYFPEISEETWVVNNRVDLPTHSYLSYERR